MTSLFQVTLINYECSCGSWFPLCQLYFCRKCNQLKCPMCLNEEIDIVFCPHCMENNSINDAQQRKHRCNVCHECPMCANLLVIRSQGDRHYYLQCNACHWTSRNSGIEDQVSSAHWPEHSNPMEEKLNEVLVLMKSLGNFEKMERGRQTQALKRLSNLGPLSNDRFGLQSAYNMRKKALSARPKSTEILIQSSADVPELDPSIFNATVDAGQVPTLLQILNQPLSCESGLLLPPKVKLISRRSLRCVESDMIIYKGEYSPNVVKPRMQSFALDFVPDVRISREVKLVPSQPSSFFLVVSNNSGFFMKVDLKGEWLESDSNCIDCSDFALEISIPSKDDVADVDDYIEHGRGYQPKDTNDKVMFTRRHRVGLCVECKPKVGKSTPSEETTTGQYALFRLEFSHVGVPTTNENIAIGAVQASTTRVKVLLKNSLDSITE